MRSDGLRPLHREPLLDVRLDLRAEPEVEAAARRELQVVRRLRERHRVAGERDHDRGRELHALGVLGREQQREERVVLALERVDAVVAGGFDRRVPRRARRAGRWSLMRRRRAWAIPTIGRWSTSDPKPTASGSPTSTTSGTSRSTPRPRSRCWPSSRHGGRALELGIGTGRIALPLAATRRRGARHRRVARDGRAACAPSRAATRSRSRSATWPTSRSTGEFALVFVVFNTFFQLYSQEAQLRCFAQRRRAPAAGRPFPHPRVRARHVARRSGRAPRGQGGVARPGAARRDGVRRAASSGSTRRRCASPRTGSGSCTPSCGSRGRPSSTSWPGSPGSTLEHRWATFDKQPFTGASAFHVSVYRA